MEDSLGVYVTVQPKGKLKRDLAARGGRIPLEDSTVEQAIIDFSELDVGPYATVVDYIATTANYRSMTTGRTATWTVACSIS